MGIICECHSHCLILGLSHKPFLRTVYRKRKRRWHALSFLGKPLTASKRQWSSAYWRGRALCFSTSYCIWGLGWRKGPVGSRASLSSKALSCKVVKKVFLPCCLCVVHNPVGAQPGAHHRSLVPLFDTTMDHSRSAPTHDVHHPFCTGWRLIFIFLKIQPICPI